MIILGMMRDMKDWLPCLSSIDGLDLAFVFRMDLYELIECCSDENSCHVEVYSAIIKIENYAIFFYLQFTNRALSSFFSLVKVLP